MIQSILIVNASIGKQQIIARSIVVKLLLSPFNSAEGITVCADMPFGQKNLLNISRPAVLRTYYGMNTDANSPTQWTRITYGPTSLSGSLSMDPMYFTTKAMSVEMYELGNYLKTFVKRKFEEYRLGGDIFDCEFNHCTVLVYNAHMSNVNCKLPFHCDCQYNHKGEFKYGKNTQGENTPVIVYSMGDPRTMSYRQRWVVSGKKNFKKWHVSKNHIQQYKLTDNSIFVLHPRDEQPMIRIIGEPLSQFQHGHVNVNKGDLSMGLIFRNVTHTLVYDNVKSTRILPDNYLEGHKSTLYKFDSTYKNLQHTIHELEHSYQEHIHRKLSNWNYIS